MKHAIFRFVSLCVVVLSFSFVADAFAEHELTVSAAASLTNAFGEIGKKFESANPGTKVVFNFGASGVLFQQIDKGAPVDVFASADQKTMDQAMEKNLIIPDTRQNFVSNELVLIYPHGAKTPVKALQDLAAKEIGKVALGNPETVPAGRYTQEVLTNEGLWEELKPKFIFAESVRQVLDYVSRGEVDAGFVFATDAAVAKDRVETALEARKHKPITYPISVVGSTGNGDLARRFVEFVVGAEGREILSKHGFNKP
ncbi:MAG: molybdate ABC transporter substrate-binding protein [Syntrophobacteraceae bacterium]|jgi:molybdate transport system substrate-binding protein